MPEQAKAMAKVWRLFAGRNLFITSYTGDAESARLGLHIKAALEGAGIHVDDNLGRTIADSGGVAFGISISGPLDEKIFIDTIARQLWAEGKFDASSYVVQLKMCIESAMVGVMVALKPLPKAN